MKNDIMFLCIFFTFCAFGLHGVSAIPTNYTYSLSANFTNGILIPEFKKEIADAHFSNSTLLEVTVDGDVVNIEFQDALIPQLHGALTYFVSIHTAKPLINNFCADLPDAPTTITMEMLNLGVLVTQCTVARDYTFVTATEIIESREYNGKFVFINDGSAAATIVMGTGGSTNHNMVINANSVGQFMYAVSNDITGSHAYMLFRVA